MNIDTAFALLSEGFSLVLLATWRALPLLLIAGLVAVVLRNHLAPRYHALLWSVVICRLLLPVSVPSGLSLHGPLQSLLESHVSTNTQTLPPVYATLEPTEIQVFAGNPKPSPLPMYVTAEARTQDFDIETTVGLGILTLWLGIAVVAIGRMVIAHWRFARRLRSCHQINNDPLVDLILRECDSLRVPRRPRVKEVPELMGPAVFGLFRSTICLPLGATSALSSQELRLILRHELAHVRRRDAWLYTVASIAQSLHWFNPLAWIATSRLRLYVEAAADELALSTASPEEVRVYGNLSLNYATQNSSTREAPAIGLLHFGSAGRLKKRIMMLGPLRLQRRWVRATLLTTLLALAISGLSDAALHTQAAKAEINIPDLTDIVFKSGSPDDGPVNPLSYDVKGVLQKIAEQEPFTDSEEYLRSVVNNYSSQPSTIANGHMTVKCTERQHRALSTMLEAWRNVGPKQVMVEIRIIAANAEIDSSIDWFEGRISGLEQRGSQPVIAARVSNDQLRQFIQRAQSDVRSNILMAPKVTLFNGQSGTISSGGQRPLVTAVEFRARNVLQPVVDVVEESLSIMVQPFVQTENELDLTFELRVSKLKAVELANLPIRYPDQPHTKVTVQVPLVGETTLGGSVFLKDEQSILIAAPRSFDSEHSSDSTSSEYVVLTPRIIQP